MNFPKTFWIRELHIKMCRTFCALLFSIIVLFTSTAQQFIEAGSNIGITSLQDIDDDLANGMSFYDYNQDGWDDITMPAGQNSVVFYRNTNGFFQEDNFLTVHPGNIRQLLWIDYNSDDNLDLFISYYDQGVRLYENDGSFSFTDVTQQVGISTQPFKSYGVAVADPDGDFDLDIYICAYALNSTVPGALKNLYYQNDGTNNFNEIGENLGIDNGYQPSFMPVWYDFDNDGDVDLHVINDREYTSDALFVNNGFGQFTEQAFGLGISNDDHSPMSLTIGDFNNDGYFDVFESDVANGGVENGLPTNYKVFENNGGNGFTNTAPVLGVDTSFFAWGGLWVDCDNDGFQDLYIATGENDNTGFLERPSVFYKNLGGTAFSFANDSIQANITHTSYSPVKGDLNNDGFYDIVVLNGSFNPHNVLLNVGNANNYIKITPVTSVSNTQAFGGRVDVYANGQQQSRMIKSSDGMCAQNSQHMIVGVGSATVIDSIRVTFPSGLVTTRYAVLANQSIEIFEQSSASISLSGTLIQACPGDNFTLAYPGLTNYEWSDGSTNSTLVVTQSGTYSFVAENFAGDTVFFLNPITVTYEPSLLVSASVSDNPCGSNSQGAIELVCSPSQIVSSVIWGNGTPGLLNDNLASGSHSYEITTTYGCDYTGFQIVETEPDIDIQYITTPYTDTDSGTVELFVWGGAAPFEFVLDTSVVSSAISGLVPGSYTIYVTDQNGCSDSVSFIIQNNATASNSLLSEENFVLHVDGMSISIFDPNLNVISVQIFDITGKQIAVNVVNQKKNSVQFDLDVSPGVYQVRTDRWTQMITILGS